MIIVNQETKYSPERDSFVQSIVTTEKPNIVYHKQHQY